MMDFVGNGGMGTTHAMVENRLIWIVTRMHIEMIRYPVWCCISTLMNTDVFFSFPTIKAFQMISMSMNVGNLLKFTVEIV